jgi:hypothetical protein
MIESCLSHSVASNLQSQHGQTKSDAKYLETPVDKLSLHASQTRTQHFKHFTSVEPERERLGGGVLLRLGEVVEEAPAGLDVHVASELPERHRRLPR